jgi:hypothetical protein
MKRIGPAAVLLGLLGPAPVHAQKSPPKALDQTVTSITWPAQYLKDLPADYLERQRARLVAGTHRPDKLNFNTSAGTDSIGWVRYGLPALILGNRLSTGSAAGVGGTPKDAEGATRHPRPDGVQP